MAPASSQYQPAALPRRRTTAEQLSERRGSGNQVTTPRSPILLKSEPEVQPDKRAESRMNDSIERVRALIKKYGPINGKPLQSLEVTLKKLDGPALLKLAMVENEVFIHCDYLFKRLCKREADITTKKDTVSWHSRYAKFYFKRRPASRYHDWETELLTKDAYQTVHESIRCREEARARIKGTEIPEMLIAPNRKLKEESVGRIAKERAVKIVRAYTFNINKVQKKEPVVVEIKKEVKEEMEEEIKSELEEEVPAVPEKEYSPPQQWYMRKHALGQDEEAPLWKKCKKEMGRLR